jgi:hypothetical protein
MLGRGVIMSVAEFLLAFASIVIGLGLSDLLISFHRLLRAAPRVKWDWLTLCFAILMVFLSVTLWWFSFYWFNNSPTATMASFLPKLIFLCLGFLMMAAALPDEVPQAGIDLRAFYLDTKKHRWFLVAAIALLNIILLAAESQFSVRLLWYLAPTGITVALAVACAYSTRTWLHVVAIGYIAVVSAKDVLFYSLRATS